MTTDVRADGHEHGVEGALAHGLGEIRHLLAALELHAEREDPGQLVVEHVALQAIGGDPVAHHPAGLGGLIADGHVVSAQRELVGAGEP